MKTFKINFLQTIRNSRFSKGVALMMVLAIINLNLYAANSQSIPPAEYTHGYFSQTIESANAEESVLLKAGTLVSLEFNGHLSSKDMYVGKTVDMRVVFDVRSGDKVLIPAGAMAKGKVTSYQKQRAFGRAGFMEITVQYVQAGDGQMVPLNGGIFSTNGQPRKALAWGLIIGGALLFLPVAIVGVFVKGKPAEITRGTTLEANVVSNTVVKIVTLP